MGVACDILTAWNTITTGVTPKTTSERQKYWRHWTDYCKDLQIDPTLQGCSKLQAIITSTAFGTRVRTGCYSWGRRVKVSTVSTALSAITKTLELVGTKSPIQQAPNIYLTPIQRMLEGFRRTDAPNIPQLAVPVTVPHHCYNTFKNSTNQKERTTADLTLVAFYYLLRVGEYTKPRFVKHGSQLRRATRTIQFTVGCIGFFKDGKLLPRTLPLSTLLSADSATLRIVNQKNGRMGTCIHHQCSNKATSPVKALARLVHHKLSNGGNNDTLLCDFWDTNKHTWQSIQAQDIITMTRKAVKSLNLHQQGIDPDLVGAHSLRAGGAMALKMHGHSDTTIMKMGRWSSLTFLMYIHTQIAHIGKDISKDMSEELPFLNIACIDIRQDMSTNTTSSDTTE